MILSKFDRSVLGIPGDPPCVYCDLEIRDPVMIFWATAGSDDVFLHVPCAERLAVHLLGDVREANLVAGTDPRWAKRVERAFLRSLARDAS